MARKPSGRSNSMSKPVDLNLIPYLDVVVNIIMFMLFTSTGLIQIGVINVNAPRYQDPLDGSGSDKQDDKEEKKDLNLTVGITYKGFYIAAVGGVLPGQEPPVEGAEPAAQDKEPTIRLLGNDPACASAMARNVPPPAACYDYKHLTLKMIDIKNAFPQETKVIIFAQPDVPYEVLVKVMDATRQQADRALFYDVILSPEIS
ncbi:MAG TPA: biopolymer transporter ExbD [Myxococcota bacterium]|nr:biopolymer transporter ExbD [Myxococcota bacterium]HRY95029.1 biopolymer transporter ExbD [Myxococcota bacterium]